MARHPREIAAEIRETNKKTCSQSLFGTNHSDYQCDECDLIEANNEIAELRADKEEAERLAVMVGDFAKRAIRLFRDFAEKVDPHQEKPMANAIDALGMILQDHLAALQEASKPGEGRGDD